MAKDTKDFVESNRRLWDGLVEAHAASDFYNVEGFKAGRSSLGPLERREVGSVEGKRAIIYVMLYFNDIATQGIHFACSTLNTQNAAFKSLHSLFHCLSVACQEIH